MSPGEALEVARTAESATPEQSDAKDPQGLKLGQSVSVVADLDSGELPVVGSVRFVDRDSIAIVREDARVGTVCIHFPRVGYRVMAA
jgi:glutathione S-transferase